MTDETHRADTGELRQIVERLERIAAEKQEAADLFKDVMAEAKGRGYQPAILRKVLAIRKRDRDEVAEEDAILEMYMEAVGDA